MADITLPAGPILAVCGWSGSGKTTLLERALPDLTGSGLRVCVVKHDAHGIRYDARGKDSDRLFDAGADVALGGPGESFVRRRAGDRELSGLLAELLAEYDLVLVEGHKDTPLPKLWLPREGDPPAAPDGVTAVQEILPWDTDRLAALRTFLRTWLPEAWREPPVYGGILLGGESRRMGAPKHLLEIDGQTLYARAEDALRPHVARIVRLGEGTVPEGATPDHLPDPPGLAGPLAGILAALRWAPHATWVFAPADHPGLRPESVGWLLEQRAPGRWAVLPHVGTGPVEPLLALYDARARRPLEALAAGGLRAPSRHADHPCTYSPPVPDEHTASWINVNTPEEWKRWRSEEGGEADGGSTATPATPRSPRTGSP
ncbi:MAG: molybdopterin-guanine dinucleotide biosynthesis protein B [Gemmatimonadetes bacterium]|nr:molybdopterin-guanine dinucleotide biosynthesis protein B [Gemmatimonadota bacterium]